MKHSDMPAMPVEDLRDVGSGATGLFKREFAAIAAMKGILSNDPAVRRIAEGAKENAIDPCCIVATGAVLMADALLAELEKDRQP